MEARAEARYIRTSPQKARLVIDLIRGQRAGQAINILRSTNKRLARHVRQSINRAVNEFYADHPGCQVAYEQLSVATMRGFHMVPPLFRPLWRPLRLIDDYGRFLEGLMLNVAFRAEKRP